MNASTSISRSTRTLAALVAAALVGVCGSAPTASASAYNVGGGDIYDASFDVDGLTNNFRLQLVYGGAGTLFQDTTSYIVNENPGHPLSSVNNLLGGTLSNSNLGTNNDGAGILTRAGDNINTYTATWHIDLSGSGTVVSGLGLNGGIIGIFGDGTNRDVTWEVSTDNATWTTWLRGGDLGSVGTQNAVNDATTAVLGATDIYIRLTGSQTGGLWWNTQAARATPSPGQGLDIQVTVEAAAAAIPAPAALPAGLALLLAAGARRRH